MHGATRRIAVTAALLASVAAPNAGAHQAVDETILQQIKNEPEQAIRDRDTRLEEGRRLFFEETFDGNGRTCGTCHPATNNFTLDPQFIRTLRRRDPLFVAETNPALRELENPDLLRRFALITENLDGFDQPGVLRGVPHTLALRGSRTPQPGSPTAALSEVLGWSGDGAPGTGSLREFAIGAVVQHFPKTLNRVPDVDFRLPTEQELDALLAFQLSLGRQTEIVLDDLTFTDPTVERGKTLFQSAPARDGSTRSCSFCHANAGAADANGANRNAATGVAMLPTAPACRGDAPGDGGFGQTPVTTVSLCGEAVTFRGDQTMNTPSLIEAADTPPFFHNNSAGTIEEAVAFYTTDTFNDSAAGAGRAFVLSAADIQAVGGLLRSLDTLENIRQSDALAEQAKRQTSRRAQATLAQAVAETGDAIEVLTRAPVPLFPGTDAVALLRQAQTLQRRAMSAEPRNRQRLLTQAQETLAEARSRMLQ